ncbi:leucine-rich repeat and calponin homology domain-containing protein 1 isoform X2 [Denticeps clupeoides]|uniref:leucine-rich repeat and calponin homology domain-containing protein 1 isoform X2 n=1 Tax=Denticeps clupeoides TaxID=299321 RepID=UPI0010A54B36|nr:leucine-rich repeat and calponin homology domain-containing protein 1 isoform X2 [Denticeps clupeoides]
MATLTPEPRPQPAGAGSGSSPPWSRGLERALEEAASSGYLNLSTRKLKEFPRSASNYDLTDTVHADLSKNRLTDVPSEVCHLVSLETLSLYHNCIKTVPDTLINLQSLTNLNLSRNLLCVLPPCVCSLPLRILNVSNNRLNSLPESLGQLSSLMELDISCNEITSLPRHIGRLRALRELNVRRNLLCVLPDDLVDLPLVKFDFSCNKVSTIPTCYRKMFRLQSLQFENNPLQSPPAQICMKGRVHIFKYLMQEVCRGEKMADILYLPVNPSFIISRPSTGSTEDFEQSRKQDSDSGVGSDSGDKRLSATEPSDEDSLSLTVPMTHITEEEGLSRENSTDHIRNLPDDRGPADSPLCGFRESILNSRFITYIKGRTAEFDEPLRIEEDSNWVMEATSEMEMIEPLKEAVQLLQDPSRMNVASGVRLYPVELVSVEDTVNGHEGEDGQMTPKRASPAALWEFQRMRALILERARQEAQLACQQYHRQLTQARVGPERLSDGERVDQRNRGEHMPHTSFGCPPFGLKPRSVFLRAHKHLDSADPQFTMRRRMEQLREEMELIEQLRENIESRLKVSLPEDLGSCLMDGVVLCHLANHIRPRCIASIHVPSPAVPKLSMAKCRRNVENFLDACRKMGVSESSLCSAYDVLQGNLRPVQVTICALVALDCAADTGMERERRRAAEIARGSKRDGQIELGNRRPVSDSLVTPPSTWCLWDLIGSSLVHLFCLLLLFVAYSLSELT